MAKNKKTMPDKMAIKQLRSRRTQRVIYKEMKLKK
ncbi:MAG: 50S ribosomal protein L33 [Betaproteobacteria bacterium]|nr:50S ribosomal protein L33 [Betaproteobacteria bacterium]